MILKKEGVFWFMRSSKEVRKSFLEFFRSKDHVIVGSAPVIPEGDPTLLFTNAGMNQFKPIFLNIEKPRYKRVANSQKCIRVSGKHNDLEEVGKDTYHHTFFEMLGNWSFGDYYKKEAIEWAWKLVTEVWKLDKSRLWATVYEDDDEAARLWREVTDISPDRVLRFGEKDNFWEMGETGPCGPCSEIHYYIGEAPEKQDAKKINSGDPEYIEIWNLVFIQYNREADGTLIPLPQKHVDTGAGLERIVAILQGKKSNYDTDLFKPLIDAISEITGVSYSEETGMAHRVIADHIRMLSFSIADGGLPSNEGRGYVIRRILRRAARFGRMLDMHEPFIYKLVNVLADIMGDVYPEIVERKEHIERVIKYEEELFSDTLDRGLNLFSKIVKEVKSRGTNKISGEDVFKLYDTFGFPVDLTRLLAEEEGLTIDEDGFSRNLELQKQKSRAAKAFRVEEAHKKFEWEILTEGKDSEFIGYETMESEAVIRRYSTSDDRVYVVLNKTPFYAEAGGQIGDTGKIRGKSFEISVLDTKKFNNSIVHIGKLEKGSIDKEDCLVYATVDVEKRKATQRNHTATHLLHKALREVLGEHVHQAGSLVAPDRLRFDYTHYGKPKDEELEKVEDIVNRAILDNKAVNTYYRKYQEAKKEGVIALFGEKYGDIVRVVEIENFSKELCGGTHVRRTGDIGFFKIIAETSVAAGIRRIEAVTGLEAIKISRRYDKLLKKLEESLGVPRDNIGQKIEKLLEEIKKLKKGGMVSHNVSEIEFENKEQEKLGEINIIKKFVENGSEQVLMELSDKLRATRKKCIGIFGTIEDSKPRIVIAVTDDLIREYRIKAGDIAKLFGKAINGGGGGKSHMATAGGRDVNKLKEVIDNASGIISKYLDRGS